MFDQNRDGEVSNEERAVVRRAQEADRRADHFRRQTERYKRQFGQKMIGRFDLDNSGVLDRDELLNLRRVIQKAIDARPGEILGRYDENKNGELDQDEEVAFSLALSQGKFPLGDLTFEVKQ